MTFHHDPHLLAHFRREAHIAANAVDEMWSDAFARLRADRPDIALALVDRARPDYEVEELLADAVTAYIDHDRVARLTAVAEARQYVADAVERGDLHVDITSDGRLVLHEP